MFKGLLIGFVLLLLMRNCEVIPKLQVCQCAQLSISSECQKNSLCQWDSTKGLCQIKSRTPIVDLYSAYCKQFTEKCASQYPCAWIGQSCTHFTSCTAYSYDTAAECQEISNRCITNGEHCIEKTICSSYLTEQACTVDLNGKYCYWNKTSCEDANECSKLPLTQITDDMCRAQLPQCSVQTSGNGCIESGTNCSDQQAEVSCKTNKNRTQLCYWKDNKCMDKICENALSSLQTDQQCKDFLKSCTTKKGGGCITRTTCDAATNSEACITDKSGANCFWNEVSCVDKVCKNSPNTFTTNSQCQKFIANCITTGIGCVDNTGCEAAKIEDACDQTMEGKKCHWNGSSCKLKTCINAGVKVVGHDQCTAYMETCTSNAENQGCVERTCENAPTNYDSNYLCQTYYPTGNCITKLGGGCKTNKNCNNIDLSVACLSDINGQPCFWDDNKCKDLTCTNIPAQYQTQQLCKDFFNQCILGTDNTCVEGVCENISDEQSCTTDINQQECIFKPKCYQKQCSFASKKLSSHTDCYSYMNSCTLDNSGYGCMDIPVNCSFITNHNSCKIKKGGKRCEFWQNKCVDVSCNTAPNDGTYSDNEKCNAYLEGCVVNNDQNGCMNLPSNCSKRKKQQNCEFDKTCEWIDPTCIEISCQNAHLKFETITQQNCWNYYEQKCVISNNVCIDRPSSCNGLQQEACEYDMVLVNDVDCYWDDASQLCKVHACESITFAAEETKTHQTCNSKLNDCTINSTLQGCTALDKCSNYKILDQCYIDLDQDDCKWINQQCIDKACEDAGNLIAYAGDSQCQSFSTKCTRTNYTCAVKEKLCSAYKIQSACEGHVLNAKTQCVWDSSNTCKDALFDCTKVKGSSLTAGYCNYLNNTCSINSSGNQCILAEDKCKDYQNSNDCKWAKVDKFCAYIENACVIDCTVSKGPYTVADCASFNTLCTVNVDGKSCVNMMSNCTNTHNENCTKSKENKYCFLKSSQCQVATTTTVLTDCSSVTGGGFTVEYCQGISANKCSVTKDGKKCLEAQNTCDLYKLENDCKWAITDKYCTYHNSTCIPDCINASGPFDLSYCIQYSFICTVKLNGKGCVVKKPTCAETDTLNCTKSDEGYCYMESTSQSCVKAATTPLTVCSNVSGGAFTVEYCQSISTQACSVNSKGTQCMTAKNTCSQYSVDECVWSINEKFCIFIGSACVVDCSAAPGPYSVDYCVNFNSVCTADVGSTKCLNMMDTCAHSDSANCTKSLEGYCYKDGQACISAKGTKLTTCTNVNGGTNLTFNYCQQISDKACSVNAKLTSCITKQDNCNKYTENDCYYALIDKECIWTDFNNCKQISQVQCSDFSGTNDDNCNSKRKSCKLKTGTSTCTFDCSAITGNVNHDICQSQDLSCTSKLDGTGCVSIKDTCLNTDLENCLYSKENFCYIVPQGQYCMTGTKVPLFTCSYVAGINLTANYCQSISSKKCSVNKAQTSCIDTKNTCAEYAEDTCFWALNEGDCFWTVGGICKQKSKLECSDFDSTSCSQENRLCTYKSSSCVLDCSKITGTLSHETCEKANNRVNVVNMQLFVLSNLLQLIAIKVEQAAMWLMQFHFALLLLVQIQQLIIAKKQAIIIVQLTRHKHRVLRKRILAVCILKMIAFGLLMSKIVFGLLVEFANKNLKLHVLIMITLLAHHKLIAHQTILIYANRTVQKQLQPQALNNVNLINQAVFQN